VRSARRRGILNVFDDQELFAMELVTPTSIAFTGTSASIVGDGSVEFSAVSSLSLNGVFSSEYENYIMVWSAIGGPRLDFRYRAAGTDDSTASSYVHQSLTASGTSISGGRVTGNNSVLSINLTSTLMNGFITYFYSPAMVGPTGYRSQSATGNTGAVISNYAGTHNQNVSYDGLRLFNITATGNLAMYGLRG
jgi:hypothetical protein